MGGIDFIFLGYGSKRNLFFDLFLKMFQKYIYFWNKLSQIVKFGFRNGINFQNFNNLCSFILYIACVTNHVLVFLPFPHFFTLCLHLFSHLFHTFFCSHKFCFTLFHTFKYFFFFLRNFNFCTFLTSFFLTFCFTLLTLFFFTPFLFTVFIFINFSHIFCICNFSFYNFVKSFCFFSHSCRTFLHFVTPFFCTHHLSLLYLSLRLYQNLFFLFLPFKGWVRGRQKLGEDTTKVRLK